MFPLIFYLSYIKESIMNSVFKYFLSSTIILQRWLITGIVALGVFTVSAQAATVSVSNYPLFLLSQAVTEGSPPAKQLLQAGEVGHHAVSAR